MTIGDCVTKAKSWLAVSLLLSVLACNASVDEEAESRAGAERVFAEARSAVSAANESIHDLPPGTDTREARVVLDSDLEDLRYDLADTARLLKEDRLVEALEAAIGVREEAEAIVLDVRRSVSVSPQALWYESDSAESRSEVAP